MGEDSAADVEDDLDAPDRPAISSFLRREAPYLVVLALALAGVAYSNMVHANLSGYWEFLALLTAVVCIYTRWEFSSDRNGRVHLLWTQGLHWVAVLVCMNIMLIGSVQQAFPAGASSLVLLILLALGTFLAGISLMSVQLGFLGVVLALSVPALSWLQQSVLFFIIAGVFIVGLGLTFLPTTGAKDQKKDV